MLFFTKQGNSRNQTLLRFIFINVWRSSHIGHYVGMGEYFTFGTFSFLSGALKYCTSTPFCIQGGAIVNPKCFLMTQTHLSGFGKSWCGCPFMAYWIPSHTFSAPLPTNGTLSWPRELQTIHSLLLCSEMEPILPPKPLKLFSPHISTSYNPKSVTRKACLCQAVWS